MARPELNEKFMALADLVGDSLVLLQDFKVVHANQALCRAFGYTMDEVLGNDYRNFLREEDRAISTERIKRLQQGRANMQQALLDLPDRSGRLHRLLLSEVAVIHDGRPAVLVVARELSEATVPQPGHDEIRLLLEKGSRLSAQVLRALQVELQEPLVALAEMLRSMQGHEQLPEPLQRRLQVMARTGESLLRALERVQRQALAGSESLRLVAEEFSPRQLLEEVADLVAARAELQGVAVETVFDDGGRQVLCTDRDALHLLLSQLAGHALQHASAGSLELALEHPGPAATRFRISYRGEPLAEEFRQQLEQPLLRDDHAPRRLPDQGLSWAALCGSLARELGGRLGSESRPDGQSIFFELGAGVAAETASRRVAAGEQPAAGDQPAPEDGQEDKFAYAVLVVDDDPISKEVTATILRRLGCRVATANGGQQAIEQVAAGEFQVVFMDCRMPGLDGFQTTREIRRLPEPAAARVYIVALTAHCLEQDRHLCLEAGMDDHLAKPAGIEDFRLVLQRVRRHLGEQTQRAKL